MTGKTQGCMNVTMDYQNLATVAEAARILGLSRQTVYIMVRAKEIPSIKIGGRILIEKSELEGRAKKDN